MSSLDIIADPTHHQYWFERGIETYHSYKQHKTKNTPGGIIEKDFGSLYKEFQADFESIPEGEVHFGLFLGQSMLRTTNNALYAALKEVGGREALLEMSLADFAAAQEDILKAVRQNLRELREALEQLFFSADDEQEGYLRLLEEADGEGHALFIDALEKLIEA